jgi:hypothetical protein
MVLIVGQMLSHAETMLRPRMVIEVLSNIHNFPET